MSVLAAHLQPLFAHLSHRGQEVLFAVAAKAGVIGTANYLSCQLGLQNRHSLARLLQHEGLPPIEELCGWMSVLDLLFHYEQTHTSLYQLALQSTRHPPTCYRTVKRITGKTWAQAKSEGFNFALISFLERCAELRERKRAVRIAPTKRTALRLGLLAG